MIMEREDTFYSDTADQVKVELTHDEQLALAREYENFMHHTLHLTPPHSVTHILELVSGYLDQTFYKKD